MGTSRKKADWAIVAALVVVMALLAAPCIYVGGYFAPPRTSEFHISDLDEYARIRVFRSEWQSTIYKPAGRVESLLIGRIVEIGCKPAVFEEAEEPG